MRDFNNRCSNREVELLELLYKKFGDNIESVFEGLKFWEESLDMLIALENKEEEP